MRARLRQRWSQPIVRAARHAPTRAGFALLAGISILATWSLSIAVGPFLIAFCASARQRWRAFALIATLATALAAVLLVRALEAGFAPWVTQQIPALSTAPAWLQLQAWIAHWGLAAMFAWLALPLPQAPFVVLAALLHVPSWEIFAVFFFGKGLKYAVEAYLAAQAAHAAALAAKRYRT